MKLNKHAATFSGFRSHRMFRVHAYIIPSCVYLHKYVNIIHRNIYLHDYICVYTVYISICNYIYILTFMIISVYIQYIYIYHYMYIYIFKTFYNYICLYTIITECNFQCPAFPTTAQQISRHCRAKSCRPNS